VLNPRSEGWGTAVSFWLMGFVSTGSSKSLVLRSALTSRGSIFPVGWQGRSLRDFSRVHLESWQIYPNGCQCSDDEPPCCVAMGSPHCLTDWGTVWDWAYGLQCQLNMWFLGRVAGPPQDAEWPRRRSLAPVRSNRDNCVRMGLNMSLALLNVSRVITV